MDSYGNIDEMLHGAYVDVFSHGHRSSPRDQLTLEVLGWSAKLVHPRARVVKNPAREVRHGYCAASCAWNLGMRDDLASIEWWNPNGRFIAEEGKFYGANYGQRWADPLEEAMLLMSDDPDTRRAWVPIWRPSDLESGYSRVGKDVPCTLGFGLRTTNDKLDLQVVMRSQSLSILPYDVFLFSVLQELVANTMGLEMGALYWCCNSLHVYLSREYATNRATYEWYRDATHFEGAIKADVYREYQKQMDPLDLDLSEATMKWPAMMDLCMSSKEAARGLENERRQSPRDFDPVMSMMLTGALTTWAAGMIE